MAFTKITAAGIGSTETVTLDGVSVINNESIGGNLTVTGNATIGGVLTYEDVTNVDSVGLITARNGIVVGSGITLSKDGDGFFTGVITATSYSGIDLSAVTGATGDFSIADKIVHTGDTDTAIRFPSADTITAETGGSERLRIDSSGNVTIKDAKQLLFENDDQNASSAILNLGASGASNLVFAAGGGEKARIESAGNLKIEKNLNVVGTVTATSYAGDGSNLTGISVGIQTEAASISGITTYLNLSNDDHELVVTGNNTISVIGGAQGTSHSLRIQNSGIATVTLDSTYFKFPSSAAPALPTADGSISMISFTVHKAGAVGVNTILLAGASVSFG